jgi:hypothetical protein
MFGGWRLFGRAVFQTDLGTLFLFLFCLFMCFWPRRKELITLGHDADF